MEKTGYAIKQIEKYGVFGLILLYFLFQDHQTRLLDREYRTKQIDVMNDLHDKIEALNTKIYIFENKVEILEKELQKD
ncbi:MAG: hypothetical protein ACRCZ0_11270 [Cetobacterium sp.]